MKTKLEVLREKKQRAVNLMNQMDSAYWTTYAGSSQAKWYREAAERAGRDAFSLQCEIDELIEQELDDAPCACQL